MLLVLFEINRRRYGIKAELVKEVIPLVRAHVTSDHPAYYYGAVMLRGQLIPVIDIVQLLHQTPAPKELLSTRIIILKALAPYPIGFIAEKVLQTAAIKSKGGYLRKRDGLLGNKFFQLPPNSEKIIIVDESILERVLITPDMQNLLTNMDAGGHETGR